MKAAFIYLLFVALCVQSAAFATALVQPGVGTSARVVGLFFTAVSTISAVRIWNTKP